MNEKNHDKEGEIIAQAGRRGAVTVATNMAGRGVDIKLGGNPVNETQAEEMRTVGGIYVIGTERHEARRIDNQLRGRTGRQGDPGETQFFVSLEDELMRVFASDTIKNLMGKMGLADDEPIKNSLITRSLENAQTKIEGHNFDARKFVLQFDVGTAMEAGIEQSFWSVGDLVEAATALPMLPIKLSGAKKSGAKP